MPPKFKFTREEIIEAAMKITRESGAEGVTARAVAAKLGSSSKVIFGLFENMEELQREVIRAAYALYEDYAREDTESGKYPPYKAIGMAYIRFSKEEKELFKLLFMRDRTGENLADGGELDPIYELISKNNGISTEKAKLLHLEMWAFVHGIATMLATDYMPLQWEMISEIVTDAYEGIRSRIALKEEK